MVLAGPTWDPGPGEAPVDAGESGRKQSDVAAETWRRVYVITVFSMKDTLLRLVSFQRQGVCPPPS